MLDIIASWVTYQHDGIYRILFGTRKLVDSKYPWELYWNIIGGPDWPGVDPNHLTVVKRSSGDDRYCHYNDKGGTAYNPRVHGPLLDMLRYEPYALKVDAFAMDPTYLNDLRDILAKKNATIDDPYFWMMLTHGIFIAYFSKHHSDIASTSQSS